MMYLIGTLPFLLISFIGYWAYGNGVGYNILYSNSGPTWAIALAYVAAAAQIVVSFHVSPLPEAQALAVCPSVTVYALLLQYMPWCYSIYPGVKRCISAHLAYSSIVR